MEKIEIIKTPEEVNARIKAIGREIAGVCGNEPLTMVVVMNGGLFFAAKLAEAIEMDDLYIDSIAAGSYKNNVCSHCRLLCRRNIDSKFDGISCKSEV